MDKEQEKMQFLGIFGIYKESFKILVSRRKIFTQITLSLILPLSFIFILHTILLNSLPGKMAAVMAEMALTPPDTPQHRNLLHKIFSGLATLVLFDLLYLIFILAFSLLSSSAVIYTVAAVYAAATEESLTFKNVMSAVPKVWKRLMVTSLCTALAFLVYTVLAVIAIVGISVLTLLTAGSGKVGTFAMVALAAAYMAGLVYLAVVWKLATVVAVVEDSCGFRALRKSRELIKGKKGLAVLIFLTLSVMDGLVGLLLDIDKKLISGVVCLFLLSVLVLLDAVLRTVFYFVCKSCHRESIDKSALWDQLQVYQGDYELLSMAKEVGPHKYPV